MTTLVPLSMIGLVLGFVMGVLGLFPGGATGDSSSQSGDGVEPSNAEVAEEVGNRFFSLYTQVIEDMLAHQENPDYYVADADRQELASYAEEILPMFQGFSAELQTELDQLEAEAAALAESTDETTQ